MAEDKTIFIIRGDEALLKNLHNRSFISSETYTEDADDTSQHEGSVYGDHGTPVPVLSPALVLRVTTDNVPRDEVRFIVGKNPLKCDILLDDARISDTQFAVELNLESGAILLHNRSKHGTHVTFSRQNETRVLKGTQALMNRETADIRLGDGLQIQIRHDDDPVNWGQYIADRIKANNILNMAPLELSSKIETTNVSQRPPVYIQDRRLGYGAFAQVFRAIEKYTGDVYAMKLYDKPEKARWQEQATLQRLQHEHIVRYIAYIDLPNQPAQLIMEYIRGPNLQDVLDPRNKHPLFTLPEARDVLRQLLEAVAHLHSMGMTHRDVKPANIVLVQRNPISIKLVDFGLATDALSFDTHCGSPLYLAPELVMRRGRCTNKVDVFSIGVIALALFGVTFSLGSARGPKDCLKAVLQQKRRIASSSLPLPAHYDLADRLLSELADDRPSALECLGHRFFQSDSRLDHASPAGRALVPELPTQVIQAGHWRGIGPDLDDVATEVADTRSGPLQPGPSGRPRASSPLSASPKHKRQKRGHGSASEEGQAPAAVSRSEAPSPSTRQSDASSRRPGGPSSGVSHHSAADVAVRASSSIPDTASFGAAQASGASRRNSPQGSRLHGLSHTSREPVAEGESLVPASCKAGTPSIKALSSAPGEKKGRRPLGNCL